MQIRWADVNWTDQPGVYTLADGREVQIRATQITRWQSEPDGVFDTYWFSDSTLRAELLTLTAFHPAPANEASIEAGSGCC